MNKHKNPVAKLESVNHGPVFGGESWYTFHCSACKHNNWENAKKCEKCGVAFTKQENSNA